MPNALQKIKPQSVSGWSTWSDRLRQQWVQDSRFSSLVGAANEAVRSQERSSICEVGVAECAGRLFLV